MSGSLLIAMTCWLVCMPARCRVPAWSYNTAGVPEALEAYVRTYDERNPPARGPRLLRLLGMG